MGLAIRYGAGVWLAMCAGAVAADWTPEVFDYNRPPRFEVKDAPDPGTLRVPGGELHYLRFQDTRGEEVPVLLALPRGAGPFPVAVLVHGYTSSKEQVTSMVAARFLQRGFATLALDLPMHGARKGPPEELFTEPDASKTYARIVQAVVDARQLIDLAEARRELDTSKGVYLVGYSMGGWLGALAGGAERRVAAMVLMVPISEVKPLKAGAQAAPKAAGEPKPLLDVYPVLRPTGAMAEFGPRPVLIQAGELDGYLRKSAVDTLLAAAREPKELRWYPCGHILNDRAIAEAAAWMADRVAGKKVEKVAAKAETRGGERASGRGGAAKTGKKR